MNHPRMRIAGIRAGGCAGLAAGATPITWCIGPTAARPPDSRSSRHGSRTRSLCPDAVESTSAAA
jgi:hypothetical protein